MRLGQTLTHPSVRGWVSPSPVLGPKIPLSLGRFMLGVVMRTCWKGDLSMEVSCHFVTAYLPM
jgi:hypothetical protein